MSHPSEDRDLASARFTKHSAERARKERIVAVVRADPELDAKALVERFGISPRNARVLIDLARNGPRVRS